MSQQRAGRASRTARWRERLRAHLLTLTGLPAILAVGGAVPMIVHGSITPASLPKGVLCATFRGCDAHGYDSYGYAAREGRSYWRMSAGDECTNYAAYVESTVYHAPTPRYLLGNGGDWAGTARAHGVVVNHTPSVGAVAQWNYGTPGVTGGHVAVVEKVGPSGSYIVISQDHMGGPADYDWTKILAGHHAGQWEPWPSNFIHFKIPVRADVGYYGAKALKAYFRDSQTAGPVNTSARLGLTGAKPLIGNWRGNGVDGIGYYNPAYGTFRLLGINRTRHPNVVYTFGPRWMIPVVGDWKGIGRDGVGYYDPRTGTFALRESLTAGKPDHTFKFGPPGMVPLAGDWNGGGHDGIGFYNPKTGGVKLRVSLSSGPAWRSFWLPAHMIPIVGNWLGGRRDYVGYYNKWTGTFYLRERFTSRAADIAVRFGPKLATPLIGDWFGYPRG